jgi:hypothetical protein
MMTDRWKGFVSNPPPLIFAFPISQNKESVRIYGHYVATTGGVFETFGSSIFLVSLFYIY